ncbi:MAG: DNA polymerase III subunit beta [Bacteroidaceae bacterium]|nr:DNA polymerase III subunit beta [Bacteroidaceae bacterium]
MRYIVNSAELYSHLQNLDKVILAKNTVPILSCVLFEIKDSTLNMRATDKEITLTSSLQLVESGGDSSFAINAKRILDILKVIPEQPITLDINTSSLQIELKYLNGHMVFQGESADEFPLLKQQENETSSFPVAADALSQGLANAVVATASDDARIAMQGIFFDIAPGEFAIVASDGRKLVRSLINCDTNNVTTSFILPQKPVNIIRAVVDKAVQDIKVSTYAEGNATFDMGDYVMHCRLITEAYPNYKKVIPQNNDRIATLEREALIGALRRVMVGADHATCLVKMQFEADKLTLTAENNNYAQSAEEHLLCQYEGMPIKIGFQGNFLMDLLGRLTTEEVIIQLSDPSRAGLILPSTQEEKFNILMLLMPLLITN